VFSSTGEAIAITTYRESTQAIDGKILRRSRAIQKKKITLGTSLMISGSMDDIELVSDSMEVSGGCLSSRGLLPEDSASTAAILNARDMIRREMGMDF
jgi:hypothetical protein